MLETGDKMKIKKTWVKIKTFLDEKIENF